MHFAVHLKQKIVNNYTSIIFFFFFKEFISIPKSQFLAEIVTWSRHSGQEAVTAQSQILYIVQS